MEYTLQVLARSHDGAHDEFSISDSPKLLENIKQHFPSTNYDPLGTSAVRHLVN